MATAAYCAPESADLVTLKEAVALLSDTGHPVSASTIGRWIAAGRLRKLGRLGRRDYVSASDVLEAHRDHVLGR